MKQFLTNTKSWIVVHKAVAIVLVVSFLIATTSTGAIIAVATSNVPVDNILILNDKLEPIDSITIERGSTSKVTTLITPENSTNKGIEWKTDNKDIADISNQGEIIAKAEGKATVTAISKYGKDQTETTKSIKVVVIKTAIELAEEKYASELEEMLNDIDEITADTDLTAIQEKYDNAPEWVKTKHKDWFDSIKAVVELKKAEAAESQNSITNNKTASSSSSGNNKSGGNSNKSSNNSGSNNSKGGGSGGGGNNDNDDPTPSGRTWWKDSSLSSQIFSLINQYRQANGVAPLEYNSSCQSRSDSQAEQNSRTQTNFHGYDQISTATGKSTASGILSNWQNSPGHNKQLLLASNTGAAVSVYTDSDGWYSAVVTFYVDW